MTCGSITIKVHVGSVTVPLADEIRVVAHKGSTVKIDQIGAASFDIDNMDSDLPIEVQMGDSFDPVASVPDESKVNPAQTSGNSVRVSNSSGSDEPVTVNAQGSITVLQPGASTRVDETPSQGTPTPTASPTATATPTSTPPPTATPTTTPTPLPTATPTPTLVPPGYAHSNARADSGHAYGNARADSGYAYGNARAADDHAYGDAGTANGHAYCHSNDNRNAYGHRHGYRDCNAYGHADGNVYTSTDRDAHCDEHGHLHGYAGSELDCLAGHAQRRQVRGSYHQ